MAVLKIKDAEGNWQNIVALKGDRGERGPEGPVGPAGGVNSVNGMTGDVTIESNSLPTASSNTLGGVKIGSNITNTNGTISLTKANVTNALGYTPLQTAPVTSVNGQTGAVTVEAGIPKTGDRGALAGFETSSATTGTAILINAQSPDCQVSDTVTTIEVENGDYVTSWTKLVFILNTNGNASVSLGANWRWINDEVPTIGAMGHLILHWNYIYGVATYIEITY